MKKEYKKPVIEIEDIGLSSLIATSQIIVDLDGDPIEDAASKEDGMVEW